MDDLAELIAIVAPEVEAMDLALVRLAWITGDGDQPVLQLMAERPTTRQLDIADCAALSRRISERFDALDPIEHGYRLEVSSPGIDRPLTRLSDFTDWAGHEAKVDLIEPVAGRSALRGVLAGLDADGMILIDDRKSGRVSFAADNLSRAKLVLTDRLIAATAPLDRRAADIVEVEIPEQEEQD